MHKHRSIVIRDLVVIAVVSLLVFLLSIRIDLFEKIVYFSYQYENYEIDEVITLFLILFFGFLVFSFRRWRELDREVLAHIASEKQKDEVIDNLEKAMDEIKQLKGLLPICSNCKKIRDDDGYWQILENYISEHSLATFSHSICPDCLEKLYPELAKEIAKDIAGEKNKGTNKA